MKRFLGALRLCLLVLCMFAPAVAHALSDEYVRLEYIQSNGSQYINTGFVPSASFKHTLVFEVVSNTNSSKYICGSGIAEGRSGNVRIAGNSIDGIFINVGSGSARNILNGTRTLRGKTTLVLNLRNNAENTVLLDGQNIANSTTGTITSTKQLQLFALDKNYLSTGVRIYSSTIEQNGAIVHRFIPVKRKSDNVIGMYDVMNSNPATAFHTNAGTGKFIAGPEVGIKIATKAYNDLEFEPVQTALTNARTTVSNVVSNTISQSSSIGTLSTSKQNRPTTDCPQYRQCMLVQDANNQPQWFPIVDPFYDLFRPMIDQNFYINIHGSHSDMGYTQLDYIQSSGTQYIDTTVIPTLNTGVYLRASLTNMKSADNVIFGATNQTAYANGNPFSIDVFSNRILFVDGGRSGVNYNYTTISTTPSTNVVYDFYMNYLNDKRYVFDNQSKNITTPTTMTSRSLHLFNLNNSNTNLSQYAVGGMRLYKAVFTEGNVVSHNYVPAQRKSDNEIGVYDTVAKAFLGHLGTNAFTYGATVANTDVPAEPAWSVVITGNEEGNTTHVAGTVYGTAKCNSLSATANDVATSANLQSSSWTTAGNNCWCSLTQVDTNGNAGIHEKTAWVFNENNSNCASQCAQLCVNKFIDGTNGAFRSALSGIQ